MPNKIYYLTFARKL